jgi:hypothetical protein
MGKQNLKIYMKRNYPERYAKFFPKEEKKGTNKPVKKPRRHPPNPLGIKPVKFPRLGF